MSHCIVKIKFLKLRSGRLPVQQPTEALEVDDTTAAESSTRTRSFEDTTLEQTTIDEISRIGYFDPDSSAPSKMGPVRNAKGEFIYSDVFAFIDRLRAVSFTMKTERFTNILRFLPNSFRNSASTWYNEELNDHERDLLLSEDTEIEIWHAALTNRFGVNGHRLAQSSVPPPQMAVERGRRKKPKSEKVVYFEQRRGEGLDEWQRRIGKRDA